MSSNAGALGPQKWADYSRRRLQRRREKRREIMPGFPRETPLTVEEVGAYLSGERIQCLLCGKWYKSVAHHIRLHGWEIEDYKSFYRLPMSAGRGATSQATRERYRQASIRRNSAQNLKPYAGSSHRFRSSTYREQRSDLRHNERARVHCPVCGTSFYRRTNGKVKRGQTCSWDCGRKLPSFSPKVEKSCAQCGVAITGHPNRKHCANCKRDLQRARNRACYRRRKESEATR